MPGGCQPKGGGNRDDEGGWWWCASADAQCLQWLHRGLKVCAVCRRFDWEAEPLRPCWCAPSCWPTAAVTASSGDCEQCGVRVRVRVRVLCSDSIIR